MTKGHRDSDSCEQTVNIGLRSDNKHLESHGKDSDLRDHCPSLQPVGGANRMNDHNAGNLPAQDTINRNVDSAHHAAKSVFLSDMASKLNGEDAAHCEKLATSHACASAFLAPHMEGWPI